MLSTSTYQIVGMVDVEGVGFPGLTRVLTLRSATLVLLPFVGAGHLMRDVFQHRRPMAVTH